MNAYLACAHTSRHFERMCGSAQEHHRQRWEKREPGQRNREGRAAQGLKPEVGLPESHPGTSAIVLLEAERAIQEIRWPSVGVLHGSRFSVFRSFGCKAVSPIIADRLIDDRSAIDTFPGIEHQEEVREALQHHQSFALWAIHDSFPPRYENWLTRRGNSNLRSRIGVVDYQ